MSPAQALAKLERMVSADLDRLSQNLFVRDGDRYHVFDLYEIHRERDLWMVIKHLRDPRSFGHLHSAVAWCIADKYQQHVLSIEIQRLDQQITALETDITVRRGLQGRMRQSQARETVDVKLQSRQQRLAGLQQHLTKYVNRAKYLQIRGFNNEAARTGRPASNRTY